MISFISLIIIVLILSLLLSSSTPTQAGVVVKTPFRCNMQLPFNFAVRGTKLVDVQTKEHVVREDERFCGYSIQKLFAQFDDNATRQVMAAAKASNTKNKKGDDITAIDVFIDDLKLISYTVGKPKTRSGKTIDSLSNPILLRKLQNETNVRLIDAFLEKAVKKQDAAADRAKRDKLVIDEYASQENPVLYYLTVADLGDFFHCAFQTQRTDLTSDQEVLFNVEFSSNYPCFKKDEDFDDDDF